MSYPNSFKNRQMQDLRLGIKSSYNKIRNTIALLYCIYLANDKKAICDYSISNGNTIELDNSIFAWIRSFIPNLYSDADIEQSKLITSQIEAIQVCLELVFALAKVIFNSDSPNLSERTGKNRYPKTIKFASNIRILDEILSSYQEDVLKQFLSSWLADTPCPNNPLESKVCEFLTLQTEKCVLKMRFKNSQDIIFQQEGIYEILASGDDGVEISDDEKVGTYRVLNSFVNEGLHSYLTNSNGEIKLRKGVDISEFKEYLAEVSTSLDLSENRILNKDSSFESVKYQVNDLSNEVSETSESVNKYLRAMRTKPFLLLAGISGTGKSRIVKQMAFDSCPDGALRNDPTSPGNYCLIEVKPNWHDSTELLGYESQINGAHYQLTPFIKFVAKAMIYAKADPQVPFFVCLDEMNLAPVEQYFAEFLSVLESRTKIGGHIVSEPLIPASIFANKEYKSKLKDDLFTLKLDTHTDENTKAQLIDGKLTPEEEAVYADLEKFGLRIPENLIVIGTVNMDETTHQFSRKVIDRAMTIEMNLPEGTDAEGNEIDPFMDFFNDSSDLAYRDNPESATLYLSTQVKAADVVNELTSDNAEKTEWLKGEVAKFLNELNANLDGTPFKVAYRVQNELMLYFYQLWLEDKSADWEKIFATSADQILMMKVLPRIEGDEELLEKPLKRLTEFCAPYPNASKKLAEMTARLEQSRFASFWP